MKLFYTPEAPSGTADLIASRSPPGQGSSVRGAGGMIPKQTTQEASIKTRTRETNDETTKTNNEKNTNSSGAGQKKKRRRK